MDQPMKSCLIQDIRGELKGLKKIFKVLSVLESLRTVRGIRPLSEQDEPPLLLDIRRKEILKVKGDCLN